MKLFKKQEPTTVTVLDKKQELATVEVRDIKQYLVDEYERSQKLFNEAEYLKRELERAREVKMKYDATLVTLDEYSKRLENQERRLKSKDYKIEDLQRQLDAARDELNTCKIQLSRAAITREEIKDEIVADAKMQIAQLLQEHKGGMSKALAAELVRGFVLAEKVDEEARSV